MRCAFAPLLVLASCTTPAPVCTNGVLVVGEAPDLSASEVGSLPLDGTPAAMLEGSQLGADPALASSAGRHFFVARDLDMIFEIDSCGRGIGQWSAATLGDPHTDPQDVAVAADGSLWVPRFLVPQLLVIGTQVTTIDLAKFDSDGNPDMSSVRIVGNDAFVTLERLNPYPQSVQPSQVLVLDTTTLQLVKQITLVGRNPFGPMVESPGALWLAEPGNFADAAESAAGIEVVDTQAMTSKLLLPETSLGGSVTQVAVGQTCGAAIVAGATTASKDNSTALVTFALDGSSVSAPILSSSSFDLRGLLFTNDGRLLVGDRRRTPDGFPVHVFTVGPGCALSQGTDLIVPKVAPLAFAD
jgi:hypothetical protein